MANKNRFLILRIRNRFSPTRNAMSHGASIYDIRAQGGWGSRNAASFAANQFTFFGQREGRGDKKVHKSVDIIY